MIELFFRGGWQFMTTLTILLVITMVWIICTLIMAYFFKQKTPQKYMCLIGYGKTIGLFALIVGIVGQILGLYTIFCAAEESTNLGLRVTPEMVLHAIKSTMIVTMYGLLIYLFSILLWFIASILIKKRLKSLNSV